MNDEILLKLFTFGNQVNYVPCECESNEGRVIKADDVHNVIIYDRVTMKKVKQFPSGHTRSIRRIAVWESGRAPQIITASGDSTLRVFDFEGKILRKLDTDGHLSGKVLCVAVTQGEPYEFTIVASGGDDGKVCLWNLKTGKLKWALEGHQARIISVTFCVGRGGAKLVASLDFSGEIRLWDRNEGRLRRILPPTSAI